MSFKIDSATIDGIISHPVYLQWESKLMLSPEYAEFLEDNKDKTHLEMFLMNYISDGEKRAISQYVLPKTYKPLNIYDQYEQGVKAKDLFIENIYISRDYYGLNRNEPIMIFYRVENATTYHFDNVNIVSISISWIDNKEVIEVLVYKSSL